MTAADVEQALRSRFAAPQHALIVNVRNDAGHAAHRTCDALAIGTWPSTGCDVHGIEIKVARGDWLKEINDPTKADAFAKYTDFWWIATPKGIVQLQEMPATWGLMEVVNGGTKIRRPATRNPTPKAISRGFLAAIARRAIEQCPSEQQLKAVRDESYSEARKEERQRRPDVLTDYEATRAKEKAVILDAFMEAADQRMYSDTDATKVGRRVRQVLGDIRHIERARERLNHLLKQVQSIAEDIEEQVLQERKVRG